MKAKSHAVRLAVHDGDELNRAAEFDVPKSAVGVTAQTVLSDAGEIWLITTWTELSEREQLEAGLSMRHNMQG
jgi:hypothetical protein